MRSDAERQGLKGFANLLDYPALMPAAAGAEIAAELAGQQSPAAEAVARFTDAVRGMDLRHLQEVYTSTFDLQPSCCLYVGYHLFGDSYKRSAMLAKLNEEYRRHSFSAGGELPDHLVPMLRFLASTGDEDLSRDLIEECLVPALGAMARAFGEGQNPYGHTVRALLAFLDPTGSLGRRLDSDAGALARGLPALDDLGMGEHPPCAAWR